MRTSARARTHTLDDIDKAQNHCGTGDEGNHPLHSISKIKRREENIILQKNNDRAREELFERKEKSKKGWKAAQYERHGAEEPQRHVDEQKKFRQHNPTTSTCKYLKSQQKKLKITKRQKEKDDEFLAVVSNYI